MAGGTGGHVFPALAVAEVLRARGAEVFWIGTRAGMEARLVPAQGFEMEWVGIQGIRGKGAKALLTAPVKLAAAVRAAAGILSRRGARVVLGMGGFVAGPGGLAAKLQGRRLVIHEQNSVPGLTNQWLARLADRVFEAFPGSFPAARRAEDSGNPVRAAIAALPAPAPRLAGRSGAPRLLVVGGSLGAKALNETVPAALTLLPSQARPQVRHQAGEKTLDIARAAYAEAGVAAEITPFIDDMGAAYAWADLVVCRAGALTVSEIAAAGVPAVFVPFPYAVDDHQVGNAHWLTDAGAARLIIQKDLTPATLAEHLRELLTDSDKRLAMAEAGRAKARLDAAERIADACLELAGAAEGRS
ncbi:undecaprenyldiphospho-muramoylpentapeptide beta-N-acetylglucosaminyltransferase [Thiohalocapsa halophila]|uniref:UDP-N-acetylglucosamine--N-acetylmuramyl-(pentapeptide) pyrophosphoryl-undecaprenol N-acetylglucosamine transferase n=1 Tax=Thiohalocapsa halophila TaxID=69359 RepID=A0ABS1CKU3_9GAMM|nr:undecaprenyldiphospho-muramoylpentapeptide beta-N-acetylglucosaminyltransferase [Thiohalocapsa halophila]MBK1632554.1 undecaprenyldiphospho-muramoylpentapeptide beta-N-acetylglucosaminyltransferase [Thiohalocapsa halophila]